MPRINVTGDAITPIAPWALPVVTAAIKDATDELRLRQEASWTVTLDALPVDVGLAEGYCWIVRLRTEDQGHQRDPTNAILTGLDLPQPAQLRARVLEAVLRANPEDYCVDLFAKRLTLISGELAFVIARPDRDQTFEASGDAVLDHGGRHLAIEHTTVDYLIIERKHRVRFRAAIAPIEDLLPPLCPGIDTMVSFPYGTIPAGREWASLPELMSRELATLIPGLPMSSPFSGRAHRVYLQSVPMEASIQLWRSDGATNRCYVSTGISEDQASGADLRENVRLALTSKAGKLGSHRAAGRRLLLLLDSDELSPFGFYDVLKELQAEAAGCGMDEIHACFTGGRTRP